MASNAPLCKIDQSDGHLPSTTQRAATHNPPASEGNILDLPNEIVQEIASFLPTYHDVLRFSQTCRDMWAKVFAPESVVWRALFTRCYDVPSVKASSELRHEYQARAIVLGAKFNFAEKEDDRQYLCMQVLKTMLEEAITVHLEQDCHSKTLDRLYESLKSMNLLKCPQKEDPSELFFALQLCLTPLALDSTVTQACHRTDYNLATLYSFAEELGEPYIDHVNLNLEKVLQMRSFWQRHLLTASELTYSETFASLPAYMKPQVRKLDPDDGRKLSTSWLGVYSCLHPLPETREEFELLNRQTCADLETHVDVIDVMTLKLKVQPNADVFWPQTCREIIPLVGSETRRVYFEGKQNIHGITDEDDNTVFGFTEDIDVTYGEFSGWTRICFTIWQGDTSVNYAAFRTAMADAEWVHSYEALIIPGGRVMLGRWVDTKDQTGRGPFIFWDV